MVTRDTSLKAFTSEADPVISLHGGDPETGQEFREYLKASSFPVRSHRARGERIEKLGITNVDFLSGIRKKPTLIRMHNQ